MDAIRPLIPYLVPLLLLQLGLMIAALRDLAGRDQLNGPKWLWVCVIVFGQLLGPILYFTVARKDQ